MKKIASFIIAMLSLCGSSEAQSVRFGVNAGTDFAWYSSSKARFNSSDMKAGAVIGGSVSYGFGGNFAVSSGLNVTYSNANFSAKSNFYTTDNTVKYKSFDVKTLTLEIPLTVGYSFNLGAGCSLQPYVGVYARYGVASFKGDVVNRVAAASGTETAKYEDITGEWKPYEGYAYAKDSKEDRLDGLKRWDVGLSAGLKLTVGNRYTLTAGYMRGFSEQMKGMGLKNNSLRLTVGYMF